VDDRRVSTYFAQYAWLPDGLAEGVRVAVEGGRFTEVRKGQPAQPADVRLAGLVLPGLANTHSHAFHRALRGRTHDAGGTFWTWRERMYALAARLDPDSYLALARAVYAEMALAGITAVGEFHYLHHQRGGSPYTDPNEMGRALIEAARDAGLRITLLDACYLVGGLGPCGPLPLDERQLRFGDGTAQQWAERFADLRARERGDGARVAAAIHSVRSVPRESLGTVVSASAGGPLHVHLSEQRGENEQCVDCYGVTPTRLLADAGALTASTTAVHATQLTVGDIALLASAGTAVSVCPTTERDLADGIGPAHVLHDAGSPLTLGSDQNAVIDMFDEARALEMDERLATGQRGRFTPAELIVALTSNGHRSLGWKDAGRIEVGQRADLVAVRLDTPRTAGIKPGQVAFAASAADVQTVIVDGRTIVADGQHMLGDVGRLLTDAIAPLW
jgi:formiminoglutamate deiminase